jgi:hypothetical protein
MGSRALNKLSARAVKTAGDGMHGDGGGLYLRAKGDVRSWVVRFTEAGKKREMGLGSTATVSLAEARAKAAEVRALVAAGQDPIATRKAPVARSTPALTGGTTFRDAMDGYLALNAAAWTSQKHQKEWPQTLNTHAAALMGKQLADITMDDIEAVLVPIWTSAPARAKRVTGQGFGPSHVVGSCKGQVGKDYASAVQSCN